jgi:peroxiredoxin family protein
VGIPATLFFTMEASRALLRPGDDGAPAWRRLPAGEGEDGERGHPGGAVDDRYAAHGVAGFDELLAACAELGVRFMVCEMGLRAKGLSRDHLRDDLPIEQGGVVTFLNDASRAGAMLFI